MARRRGHGEGGIHQRKDGRWIAVISLGWQDGRRQRKVLYGKTRREVTDKLKQAHLTIEQGRPLLDDRRRTGDFLKVWLDEVVKVSRAPSTYRTYEQQVRLHIIPSIGRVPLAKLGAADIQRLLNEKRAQSHKRPPAKDAEGRAVQKLLSPRSVQYMHAILRSALTTAERWGYVQRNVAKLVEPVTVHRQEVTPFTAEEVKRLLAAATDDRLGAFYTVALAIGLRPSEALGLVWNDVDLQGETALVHVRMSLQRRDGNLVRGPLKTARSRRSIPLPDACVKALKAHRKRQQEEQLAAREWHDTGLVFTTTKGTALEERNVARSFDQLQERAGVARHRLYDARHTAATLLLMQGVHPRVVMEVLGHSTYRLTMDTYTHVMPSLLQEAASAMDRALAEPATAEASQS